MMASHPPSGGSGLRHRLPGAKGRRLVVRDFRFRPGDVLPELRQPA
jgi:hypothetical protein